MAYLGRKGAPAPLTSADIPDDSITGAKIVADAVGSSDLAPDITLTGDSVTIPSATTGERDALTPAVGMMLYNTTLGIMQQYTVAGWASLDSPPTISSLDYPGDDTALDVVGEFNDATCDYNNDPTITHDTNSNMKAGMSVSGTGIPVGATIASVTSTTAFELSASTTGGAVTNGTLTFNTQTLVITGTNFSVGATVTIDGTAPSTVTRNSSTQITVTGTPAKTAGTKVDGLVVTNSSNLSASINVDYSPLPGWSSPASGNLGTLQIGGSPITEIDLVGGADTTSYTLTNTLPPGLALNATTGNITGTLTGTTYTTYNFTVNAIDAQAQSSPRLFNIITTAPLPSGGTVSQNPVTIGGQDYNLHIFTANGSLVVAGDIDVAILVVGGGGSGGWHYSGGGGAGGLVYDAVYALTSNTYDMVIGAGGAAAVTGSSPNGQGNDGGDTTVTINSGSVMQFTAKGGGGGGSNATAEVGRDGGSGGGANYGAPTSPGDTTQAGTTQGVTPDVSIGYAGGDGIGGSPKYIGGGGGGAGGVGGDAVSAHAGHGGAGYNAGGIFGTAVGDGGYFASGGGGGGIKSSGVWDWVGGTASIGGGGTGAQEADNTGLEAGQANTGGGGGGAWQGTGVTGGSGIVIIRYAV